MRIVLFGILFSITSISLAGMMMGRGMSGMMGSQTSPPPPPAKDANPAIRSGYHLFEKYCIQCHQAPNPNQHTAADWPAVITRMQTYMQQQHRQIPSDSERKLILDYLSHPDNSQDDGS